MFPTGEAITLWRKERRLTQAELAHQSGLARPNLSMIEQNGRDVTLSTLRRLADALGVPVGILADGIPPQDFPKMAMNRSVLDRIARFVSGQSVRLSPAEKKLARSLLELVQNKQHLKKKISLRGRQRKQAQSLLELKASLSDNELKSLVNRVEKYLQV